LPDAGHRQFSTADIVAGISVALILIPQSLAYAGIAGVPAHIGLFAAALPTIAAALFASSPYLQTGPVAMTALLTFGALSAIASPFSVEYVALAALLALVVGVMRVAIGLTRLGVVAYFMSRPVMIGFTTGATILIAASQIPTLVGVERGDSGLLAEAWIALSNPTDWQLGSVIFGVGAVLVIEGARRVNQRIPGVLIAVVGAIVISVLIGFGGGTIGEIPTGFPSFSLDLPWNSVSSLLIPGLVIALVGFTEAAAISTTFAAEDRSRWDPNREFVSQGVANLASGLSGGFPVGGSFSRSSVNRMAGAKTRWSGAVTGIAVLLFFPAAGILEPLPTAVLAAVVIVAVVRLVKPQEIIPIWRQSPVQGGVAAFTLGATLILAPRIDVAVLLGIGLAIFVHLGRELKVTVDVEVEDDLVRISPRGVIYFGSTPRLVNSLLEGLADNPDAHRLVIDLAGVGRIDFTGADALKTVVTDSRSAGLEVSFENIPPHAERIVHDVLE